MATSLTSVSKVLTNLLMAADASHRAYACYCNGWHLEAVLYLLSLPVQCSVFVPEGWPGATLMRPYLLRPEDEVAAERQDLILKWKATIPQV